ncbi:MAG: hypothetical protein PHQ84_01245 [Candidatus Omnitrophica bacterium]|jgi:hypothetical protein|nr:hypothetical protein [Candidatus Omnitrophota bacterium]MDD5077609.1 hypothetical protein [Candidatus Omnitrophota bacterium]
MRNLSVALVFICALVAVFSFFTPWISINTPARGVISKFLKVESGSSLMKISGYQVPILANRRDSRLMIEVIKLYNPGVKDADRKSWLIWVVPLLALFLALVHAGIRENRWFNLAVGILGIAIYAVGVYKLKTTNMDKMVMSINILPGLWMTLSGYFGMGVVCMTKFIRPGWFKPGK